MTRLTCLFLALTICCAAFAQSPAKPLGEWKFDGEGDIAKDTSGHGHDAGIFDGANRVKQGKGKALNLDGVNGYMLFAGKPPLGIDGPVSVEAWIKPSRKADKLTCIMGQDLHSYLLCQSGVNRVYWYVGGGGNYAHAELNLNAWNHVVATYDGKRMALWLNGREASGRALKLDALPKRDKFVIGVKKQPHLPRFQGQIDNVRLYNTALGKEQIVQHLKDECPEYDESLYVADVGASPTATTFFKTHPNTIDLEKRDNSILFANKRVGIEIGIAKNGFQLHRLYGIADKQDFLAADASREIYELRMTLDPRRVGKDESWRTKPSLMGIVEEMAGEAFTIGSQAAKSVEWSREDNGNATTLHLHWKGIDVREQKGLVDVHVTVTLKAGDPLSYWRINVHNGNPRYGIERVRFPLFNFAPIGDAEQNVLIYPQSRGRMVNNPFKSTNIHGYYTTEFEMQFQSLYNKQSETGIFFGTQQSVPCLMHMEIAGKPAGLSWRPGHFPENITFAPAYEGYTEEDFDLSYDVVVGPIKGDWYDACRFYRKWAIQQSWCSKGPLSKRDDVPQWYKNAPLYFYVSLNDSATGTHSLDKNVRIAAEHFKEWLKWADMPLPANFYSWEQPKHGYSTRDMPIHVARSWLRRKTGRWSGMTGHNFYDGNYPGIQALPEFSKLCGELRKMGGMVSPYIALEIFNQGPTENAPYAAEAKHAAIRDLYGAIRTWGGERAWQMCSWHPWWRDRLKETCEVMLDKENVGGFYMDVMRGSCLPCYWTGHGHTAAGADSMTTGRYELVAHLRKAIRAKDPDAIMTGENPSENMIDVIDGMLMYTLWSGHVPLLAAVYQDYVLRYGLELSVGEGDDFFIECASLFVSGSQIGRIRLKPRSAMISLTDPEHRPMVDFLRQAVDYYKHPVALPFLSLGEYMRPLEFAGPSTMPMLEHHNGDKCAALDSGVFRDEQGNLAVFVVNASNDKINFAAQMPLARHGMTADATVDVDRITHNGNSTSIHRDVKGTVQLKDALPGRTIIMYHIKKAGT